MKIRPGREKRKQRSVDKIRQLRFMPGDTCLYTKRSSAFRNHKCTIIEMGGSEKTGRCLVQFDENGVLFKMEVEMKDLKSDLD